MNSISVYRVIKNRFTVKHFADGIIFIVLAVEDRKRTWWYGRNKK